MKSLDDNQLFAKVKSGDLGAYEVLFNKYYKELYRFAFNFIRDMTISEEMSQEVFLYIWEKRGKIEIQTTLKTYLYSAIKNKCLNYIKLELPKQQAMSDVEDVMLAVSNQKGLDDTENERLKKSIKMAIDQLPTKCRQIFMLSRNAGMTYEEIAEELDLSKKTVENQMGIALKKLRDSLEPVYKHYRNNLN